MEEKTYQDYLGTYRRGTEWVLTTDRGNGNVPNYVFIDYIKKDGKDVSIFRFMEGGEIFEPKKIGGVERIVSIEEVSVQQC